MGKFFKIFDVNKLPSPSRRLHQPLVGVKYTVARYDLGKIPENGQLLIILFSLPCLQDQFCSVWNFPSSFICWRGKYSVLLCHFFLIKILNPYLSYCVGGMVSVLDSGLSTLDSVIGSQVYKWITSKWNTRRNPHWTRISFLRGSRDIPSCFMFQKIKKKLWVTAWWATWWPNDLVV